MSKRIISLILAICLAVSCFAVVGAVVTAQATTDYSQGFPVVDGHHTVVFTNNKGWQNVNIYSWESSTSQQTADWPGIAMNYALTNDYGEPQYIAYVPDNCDKIVFNNGVGEQTVDITILGSCAYYLDGDYSQYNVGTFDVVFIDNNVPSQPQPEQSNPTEPIPTEPSTGQIETDAKPVEAPIFVVSSSVLKMEAGDVSKVAVINSNGEKVNYSSSNKKIAKVDSKGNVTALQKGTVKITAKVGTKTLKKTVKIVNNPLLKKGNSVVKNNATLKVKKGSKITLKVTGKVSEINNTVKIKNSKIAKITSKASQPKVVINAKKKGNTTLTVKINGVKTYKVKINVK